MTPNLFADIPETLTDEWVEVLTETPGVRIERIVSRGHCSPPGFWYDQDRQEFVLLLRGEAKLRFEQGGRVVHMKAGDHTVIPAGSRHRVEWTLPGEDTVWLAVHCA